jgi:hypothetical protein
MVLRGIGRVSSAEATADPVRTTIKDNAAADDWLRILFFGGFIAFQIRS